MDKEHTYRISKETKYTMVIMATLFDLMGLIPVIGAFINWSGLLMFYFWFISKGVKPVRSLGKKRMRMFLNLFGETFVEAFFAYPGTIIMVLTTISEANHEDKKNAHTENKTQEEVQKKQLERAQILTMRRENQSVKK